MEYFKSLGNNRSSSTGRRRHVIPQNQNKRVQVMDYREIAFGKNVAPTPDAARTAPRGWILPALVIAFLAGLPLAVFRKSESASRSETTSSRSSTC
jgi:hypothetical protein